ncbi:MAG TPA: hypothetical protein VHC22_13045 [Pirellulales bacterium]|nr:hypothetical protein [Pirellulales bacterium]
MSWLFEDPTTLIVAGLLIEALLAVALVKSGRGLLMLAMAGVLLLIGLGVLIERLVVTSREQVQDTLDAVAAAVQANDVDRVLSHVDPAASGMRMQVRAALGSAHVTEVRLYDLVIEVNERANPPIAQAEFTGRIKGNYRSEGSGGEGMLLRKFTVDFRRVDDRWLMTGYQDRGAIGGRRED